METGCCAVAYNGGNTRCVNLRLTRLEVGNWFPLRKSFYSEYVQKKPSFFFFFKVSCNSRSRPTPFKQGASCFILKFPPVFLAPSSCTSPVSRCLAWYLDGSQLRLRHSGHCTSSWTSGGLLRFVKSWSAPRWFCSVVAPPPTFGEWFQFYSFVNKFHDDPVMTCSLLSWSSVCPARSVTLSPLGLYMSPHVCVTKDQ